MARLLHPSYFPATRTAPNCQYWGGFDIPLEKKMEAYWRVKKWHLMLSLQWVGELSLQINRIVDLSAPDNSGPYNRPILSEDQLVCEQFLSWFPAVSGDGAQGASFMWSSSGIDMEAEGFEFVYFEWPETRSGTVPIPVTLKIGEYSTVVNGGVANQPDTTGSGSIEAVEWWPYEDANGNALYDTSTGNPL